MKIKNKASVSIIGGADGPTSIFIAGRTEKRNLKEQIHRKIYRHRRKAVEKKIVADAHTLEEVVSFARQKYAFLEMDCSQRSYREQKGCLKESLIIEKRPDLLGELKELVRPEVYDEKGIRELHRQIQARSEWIAAIPDEEMPMDYHVYEMRLKDGRLEMEIDYLWNIFGISYSGSKKTMKNLEKVARELYLYYGVTKEDIANKSKRYSSLVTALCT